MLLVLVLVLFHHAHHQVAHLECTDNGYRELHLSADNGEQRQRHGARD